MGVVGFCGFGLWHFKLSVEEKWAGSLFRDRGDTSLSSGPTAISSSFLVREFAEQHYGWLLVWDVRVRIN